MFHLLSAGACVLPYFFIFEGTSIYLGKMLKAMIKRALNIDESKAKEKVLITKALHCLDVGSVC